MQRTFLILEQEMKLGKPSSLKEPRDVISISNMAHIPLLRHPVRWQATLHAERVLAPFPERVIVICKAYTTGGGRPFLTELNDEIGDRLQRWDRNSGQRRKKATMRVATWFWSDMLYGSPALQALP
jgi:hypothetical protein